MNIAGGARTTGRKCRLVFAGIHLCCGPIPMNGDSTDTKQKRFDGSFMLLLLLLGGTLAVLCHEGFKPYYVFWANDLPLG